MIYIQALKHVTNSTNSITSTENENKQKWEREKDSDLITRNQIHLLHSHDWIKKLKVYEQLKPNTILAI